MSIQKKKRKSFTAQVRVDVWLDKQIFAESLEDALRQARELKVNDVLEYEGTANDHEIKVTGVFE